MRRNRILLVTLGSRGDVHPYIALGTHLKAHGLDCVIVSGIGFEAEIGAQGLSAAPLDVDFRPLLTPEFINSTKSIRGIVRAWRQTSGFQDQFLSSLWRVCKEQQPDAIVFHHNKGAPALYVAAALGVPAIPTALIPAYLSTREFNNPFTPVRSASAGLRKTIGSVLTGLMNLGMAVSTRKWRRKTLGLKNNPVKVAFDGYHPQGKQTPRLHLFSGSIVPKPGDWPERDAVTGYCFSGRPDSWTPSPELEAFLAAGPAPVYLGFGSMPLDGSKHLLGLIGEALDLKDKRGVVLWPEENRDRIKPPSSIFLVSDIPHDWLFPKCEVIVHHGGIGTTHQALRWGKPSVICPMFLDQPFWASIVNQLGAAPDPLPLGKITASKLAARIGAATAPEAVAAAAAIGEQIRGQNGSAQAARVIYSFLDGDAS